MFEIGLPAPRDQLSTRQPAKVFSNIATTAVHQGHWARICIRTASSRGSIGPEPRCSFSSASHGKRRVRSGLLEYEYLPAPSAIGLGFGELAKPRNFGARYCAHPDFCRDRMDGGDRAWYPRSASCLVCRRQRGVTAWRASRFLRPMPGVCVLHRSDFCCSASR